MSETTGSVGNIVRARVTIRGTRPLLQHAFGEDAIPVEKREKTGVAGNDPTEWKRTCLVTTDGELYIRGDMVFSCLRDASVHTKSGKGSIQKRACQPPGPSRPFPGTGSRDNALR
jgi:hypothetical protein